MIDLRREGAVFVLTMNAGENRFNRAFVDAIKAALDEVEGSTGPAALVTTGGTEKFYSNGLDLDWFMGDGKDQIQQTLRDVFRMLARFLASPIPCVAAINGHAFAGGAMLAAAHDFRVMREDRGFFCLPEVDLGMPLAAGMAALLNAKIDHGVLRDLLLTGRRIGGGEAAALRVVDESVPGDGVLARALHRAGALAGKDRSAFAALKHALWGDAIATLNEGRLP
jgi:enoyl-CoA hydratase/carnithine racemase